MSKNYGNDSQFAEIVKYISDTMKFPIMGAGGGFAPIGTINSYMGTTAPIGWLACDGTVYNIADYPDLATHIASHFGSTNFFGGDGTTTFGVPDLRGEFLRGTGTNSHTNQGSGANVGVHQDGTLDNYVFGGDGFLITSNDASHISNTDHSTKANTDVYIQGTTRSSLSDQTMSYTSRPTNTSVLFIIKATVSDSEINAFNVYTPREHQVAWWEEEIDGVWKRKPVYEKRFDGLSFGSNSKTWLNSGATIQDVSLVTSAKAIRTSNNTVSYSMTFRSSNNIIEYYAFEPYTAFDILIVRYTKTTDDWQTS